MRLEVTNRIAVCPRDQVFEDTVDRGVGVVIDVLADEPDRSIAQQEVGAPFMNTAESTLASRSIGRVDGPHATAVNRRDSVAIGSGVGVARSIEDRGVVLNIS